MTEQTEGSWRTACRLVDIPPGRGRLALVNGTEIALMRDGDEVFGVGNLCPHRGGQISDGQVRDGKAICPLHLWDFDLRTGISPFNPEDALPTYPVRVRDGLVEVDADTVTAAPARPDVYLGQWTRRGATDRGMYTVHHLAEGGRPDVGAMGSERFDHPRPNLPFPTYDDLMFRPAQLDRLPTQGDVPIDTAVVLGSRAERPLRLDIPLFVSHMSYGALSPEAKEALARGASAAGTAIASGEGGAHPRERDNATRYIFEMASGYFGWNPENVQAADAVEVKIGQGAKPGLGGTLLGSKVTPEIAMVRGVTPGTDVHSPAHFPDINSIDDLAARIAEIKHVSGGAPVGIKFAAGDVEADVAAAVAAGADWITVDGFGGGTGAAPTHVKDNVGVPSMFALIRARRWLDDHGVDDVQLVATGGFRTPDEMAKALALGANAVALATSSLMAIGCQQYRACHRGTCPVGIATQDPALRDRLDVATSAERLEAFLRAATAMITDFVRICGHTAVRELNRADLVTLDRHVAERTDLQWVL